MQRTETSGDTGLLAWWSRFAVRHKWLVLGSWVVSLVALGFLAGAFRGTFASDFQLPGTESQRALELLKGRFPQQAGGIATLVVRADAGVNDPAVKARVEQIVAEASTLPGVIEVVSPYAADARAISQDGRIAFADIKYPTLGSSLPREQVDKLLAYVNGAGGSGLTVEVGGEVVQSNEQEPPGTSEMYGVVAAVFILLIAFGSVVAMGLPVITALVGLAVSFAVMFLAARVLDLPLFAPQFAGMIGLGVGIDYALLVVTRYREHLHQGWSVEDSVVGALTTSGRSVLFAGLAVAIAMLGMLAIGIPFVGALGIAGAIVVAAAVLVALTLMPALLGIFGHGVDRWRIPLFHATDTSARTSVWYRLSEGIQRRPWPFALGSLALLLLLSAPALSIRLGASDAGNSSTALHSRRAYDLLAEGFGPGFNGPLLIALDLQKGGPDVMAKAGTVREAIAAYPGIVAVTPVIPNQNGDAAILTVYPATSPQDRATQQLVYDLRDRVIPPAVAGSGVEAYVTGATAAFIDIGDRITSRMPLFFGSVIGLSFILLMMVFRSILVPVKAAIMNLLSIGASYGVVVAVFQWGWAAGLFGVKAGPIETFLPMMLFAILFGLSMDYEVFLISRIREEYLRTGNNAEAVSRGLAATARVITAAAAIMVVVFLSFVLGKDRIIKEFGLGLAVAIFVDATIVRLFLVPSTMELLGKANWWLPTWLGRILPRLDVEGSTHRKPEGIAAD